MDLEKEGRYVEMHFEESDISFISLSKNAIEMVSDNHFLRGNVRLFEKGYWMCFSFTGNNIQIVKEQVQKMKSLIEMAPQKKGFLIKGQVHQDHISSSVLKDPRQLTIQEKYELVKHYHEMMKKTGKDNLVNAKSVYKDQYKKTYFVNSEGSSISQIQQLTGAAFYAIARSGHSNIQQGSVSKAALAGLEAIENLDEEIKEAVHTSLELLKSPALPKGKYDVILDNQMAGVFAHEAFGHLSEADFIDNNLSMQEMMRLNRSIGVSDLNIIDDGAIPSLVGYTPYDDEGTKAQRNYLIREGQLVGRLHSKETASKMNESLTGNARALNASFFPLVRMTNTFIDKGSYPKKELFSMVENGVYCSNFIGGMTNLEMFTFTPAKSYRIQNGKIIGLCKDVMLSGNTFETLHQIQAIGDDLMHFGTLGGCGKGGQNGLPVTIGGPHILLKDVLVG